MAKLLYSPRKIIKLNTSCAITLPHAYCDLLHIGVGDRVTLHMDGMRLFVEPVRTGRSASRNVFEMDHRLTADERATLRRQYGKDLHDEY